MGIYSAAVTTNAPANNSPWAAIRAVGRRAKVRQIEFALATAAATVVALVRAAANGTPDVSGALAPWAATDPGPSASQVDIHWSVNPTIAGSPIYLRMAQLGAAQGNGRIWTFPEGVYIESGASLLLWNATGGSGPVLSDLTIILEE